MSVTLLSGGAYRSLPSRWLLLAAMMAAVLLGRSAAIASKTPVDDLTRQLSQPSLMLVKPDGAQVVVIQSGVSPPVQINEAAIVETLSGARLDDRQATALWSLLADPSRAGLLTLPSVAAVTRATTTPAARGAMWDTLRKLADSSPRGLPGNSPLLDFFERQRAVLLPLLAGMEETEGSGNAMVDLMTASRIFGDDVESGVRWIGAHYPAALARRIQRERDQGRIVKWEYAGFEQLVLWKDRHLVPGAPKAPRSLAEMDKASETFALLFNSLYVLDDWYRQQMLRGLRPVDAFDIVIGGETELYRMGTSSFREFLHPMVVRGIAERGSFEAFLAETAPRRLSEASAGAFARRGMAYLRVASSFGLLEPMLATISDKSAFIAEVIDSLGDPETFESNAVAVLDLVTGRSAAATVVAFRQSLLDRLYEHYGRESEPARRSIYGSLLSVYQSVTGDLRDRAIDRAYPLDHGLLEAPFDVLFSRMPDGSYVHRMFMRYDDDVDGGSNFASFRTQMSERGALVHASRDFEAYRLRSGRRTVEIYVNRPSKTGVRKGIDDLAKLLEDSSVHTIVGRGHSGIIAPLRKDAERLLGASARHVQTVIVGTCGGTSSMRELIDTFGYTRFVSTRSTGRQIINNAIVTAFIDSLLALEPGGTLDMSDMLTRSLTPFLRPGSASSMREDAGFYHLGTVGVYAAILFDRHVPHAAPEPRQAVTAAADIKEAKTVDLAWQPISSQRSARAGRSATRPAARLARAIASRAAARAATAEAVAPPAGAVRWSN